MSAIFLNRRNTLKLLAGAGLLSLPSRLFGAPHREGSDQKEERSSGAVRKLSAGILPSLSEDSRKKLEGVTIAANFTGQIPAATVRELMAAEKKSIGELMLALGPLAVAYSRPPISDFHVGVIARGASGSLYPGFNLEFPGQGLGFAVHGEQAALSSAYMHGEKSVEAIALNGAPCGHCRQFMNEFSPDGEIEIIVDPKAPMKLRSLLPMAFGPKALGRDEGAVPVKETNLTAANAPSDAVAQAALNAARHSYAPYSGANSGVAISTRSGRIHRGSYIENVAFNPSLPPLETALVQLIVAGEEYATITRVVLAENKRAKISQKSAAEAVMASVAPSVRLEIVAAELK